MGFGCNLILVLVGLIFLGSRLIDGFGTFGFDIHHRYSDPVKGILDIDDHHLPQMGSIDYYTAIPCDCRSCVKGLVSRTGRPQQLDFNIYSPNTSSTSQRVPCNSSSWRECSARPDICPYQVNYLLSNTSSTGILIEEDTLHLTTEDRSMKAVDAKIKFGCGMIQTGSFLDGAAPNGLFGLGMENLSVPSNLANSGLTANSFSMCFSSDGAGRINFGAQIKEKHR